jgi:CDP-glycerol glycerophosphotransferase (TagB/SpsB family)
VEAVGCPALDAWHNKTWSRNPKPVVAISTHWDCKVLPETRSSWPWLRQALPQLAQDSRWTLIGHHHPHEQATGTLPARLGDYEAAGIEVVSHWEEVLQRADLYLCDNSSTLFEFAATDRPVVVLQPPWYRRSARHGLRFYDALPGLLANQLGQIPEHIAKSLEDSPECQQVRRQAVHRVYGTFDGKASQRAVIAIHRAVGSKLRNQRV